MKYYGKEKCRILKEIRAEIARANDIEWIVSECKHKGNCKGTCPKCEQEVRQLEAALAKREALGKKVAVVGVSAAISLAVTGCDPFTVATNGDMLPPETEETYAMGGLTLPPETETEIAVDGEMLPVPGEPEDSETDAWDGEMMETDMGEPVWEEPVMGDPVLEETETDSLVP